MRSSKPALILALGLLGALGWAEWRLRALPNSYSLKRAGFEAQAAGLQVLVLGASEVHQGVAAGAMGTPAYNLANVGQSLVEDEALLDWALPRAPKLRWVLLGLSVQSLGYRLQDSEEAWRAFLYQQSFGVAPTAPSQWLDLRRLSRLLFYGIGPGFRHLLGREALPLAQLEADGQERRECLEEELQEIKLGAMTAQRRALSHEGYFKPEHVTGNLARLDRLQGRLQAKGIRLALFLPPVTAAYAAALDPQALARQRSTLADWAARAQVPLWDYFRDPRFHDEDFFDVDHLCAMGSDKLGRLLGARIEGGRP